MSKSTVSMIVLCFLYLLSPVDFIPDLIPLVGNADDAGVMALLVRYLLSLHQGETSQAVQLESPR